MSFKDKLARASKRTRDVRVLINGDLIRQRELLEHELNSARAKNANKNAKPVTEAVKALAAFDEQIRDEFIYVRVPELPHATWRSIFLANPLPKVGERAPFDIRTGCDTIGATIDVITQHARIIEDGEPIEASTDDLEQLVDTLNSGDLIRLATTVLELNEGTAFSDYAALGKD